MAKWGHGISQLAVAIDWFARETRVWLPRLAGLATDEIIVDVEEMNLHVREGPGRCVVLTTTCLTNNGTA